MFGIVEGEDGITEGGSEIGATFATLDDDLGDVAEGFHHVLRLADVDEAYRGGDDASGASLALTDQIAEFHQGGGSIAESKESIGVLLDSQTDASLGAGDVTGSGEHCHTGVAEVAFGLYAEAGEGSLTDAAGHHGHVGDDGLQFARLHLII